VSDVAAAHDGPRSIAASIDAALEAVAADSELVDVRLLAFPVVFRYGRQVALWSWHSVVRVRQGDRAGLGVTPGYSGAATPTIARLSRLAGRIGIDRSELAVDSAATAAVDTALCDLIGSRELGLPRAPVELEGMIWYRAEIERIVRQARALDRIGFRSVKVKLSGRSENDLRVLEAVLDHFEPHRVRVDANRGYASAASAVAFAREFVARGCVWFEEPCGEPASWSLLREHGVKVIGDESLVGKALERAVEEQLVDGINVKLVRVGGPVRALALLESARAAGVRAFVGCSEDVLSGMSSVLHVASASDDRLAEGWGAQRLGVDDWDRTVEKVTNGCAAEWCALGGTVLPDHPLPRGALMLRPGGTTKAVAFGFRAAQGIANRVLRLRANADDAGIEILSPELGWQKSPNLGGARYERIAVDALREATSTRILLPASQADGWPRSESVGRLWLPRGNRAAITAAYLPLQLTWELVKHRPRVLRLHSVTHLAFAGIVASRVARVFGWRGRTVVHVHHFDRTGTAEYPRGWFGGLTDRWLLTHVDSIIVPSNATAADLGSWIPDAGGKVTVVQNAVAPPSGTVLPVPSEGAVLKLGFAGSLIERKQPLLFVEVCRLLAERRTVSAHIVGDGPLAATVERESRDLAFTKDSQVATMESFYAGVDAIVCTSQVEGFYLVGLEALQRGIPVFGFDIPALRELLGEELADACLVPSFDTGRLADLLAAQTPDELSSLGRRSSARGAQFGIERFRRELLEALIQ
jgi:L-alanine-DL-glutamate epimerase-like enolase superfamily enzyme/glycosyltransferase involved in cell wall biosynthesis